MIIGWREAKCKLCNCRFSWYIDIQLPFIDSEIIGTCEQCLQERNHDCFDEYTTDQNGGFIKVGRKKFKKARSKLLS